MCGAECREWVWVYIRSHARLKPYCVLNRDLMVRVYVLPRLGTGIALYAVPEPCTDGAGVFCISQV